MEKDLEDNGKMRGKDIENLVDKHISCVYGPPSWYRNDEEGIANSEGISACKLKTSFSRLFGKFSKKS